MPSGNPASAARQVIRAESYAGHSTGAEESQLGIVRQPGGSSESKADHDEIEDLRQVMIAQQVRRVPVVDVDGLLVGIVAQADIAREEGAASDREVGRIVEAISEPRSDLPG